MRDLIVKVGKHITDCMDIKLGMAKMDEKRPEYWMLDSVLTDDMAKLILKMKVRKPYTPSELAEKIHWDEEKITKLLEEMSVIGIVEYNWHNEDHHKQYYVPIFVVGSAENMALNSNINDDLKKKACEFSYQMSLLPMEAISHMVPPGGAGLGFHVIPVEAAIPKDSQSLDKEHLSYWLDKYDYFAICPCQCRRSMVSRGQGCGELEDNVCVAVGDYAKYLVETGKDAVPATRKEIEDLLIRCEENGYMHQITNGDGPDEIFAICNCTIGSCYGLRCSQLFNNPNCSASSYRARVTPENCVACGKCVEACPTGAAKLGQKLCTKDGPVKYPTVTLPDETLNWGKKDWDYNFRETSQIQVYDTGTAPCKTACPAHIAIQGYIKMASEGRYDEALALIKQDNPLPAVCGSICNKRCENACTRGTIDDPVSIDAIKKYIADLDLAKETRYIPKKIRHKGDEIDYTEKIAVIGAGPAGLSCAYFLACMSYPVTVFDKESVPGGMLTKGIPSFRLDKKTVNAEIDVLKELGVEFKCGIEVGKDISIQQLRDEGYKAFYVAIGAQKSSKLNIPGEDLTGVYGGIDFLKKVNLEGNVKVGKSVAVIGGGNVAMDVARTALRLGAEKTYIIYRRSIDEMPASKDEIKEAEKEGIIFRFLNAPAEILGKNDTVNGFKVEIMELGPEDEKGRRKPVGTGKFETIDVNTVIAAIGQKVDWGTLDTGRLKKNEKALAMADEATYQSDEPDIFVGGDVYTGPKFAIDAIACGREGAISIHRYVQPGHDLKIARNLRKFKELDKSNIAIPADKYKAPERQFNGNDESKTLSMEDNRIGLTEQQVKLEASRCLGCGATVVDEKKCIGCAICTTKCKFDAIHIYRTHPEFSNWVNGDVAVKEVMKHGVKRAASLTIKKITDKLGDS